MFKPDKKLLDLCEQHSKIVSEAENLIKDKIAKICKDRNLRYTCYISTFYDADFHEIEDNDTKEIHEYIVWFEDNVAHFDPQSICEAGTGVWK